MSTSDSNIQKQQHVDDKNPTINKYRTWCWIAAGERITLEAFVAGADWLVVDDRALRVEAAGSGTRVTALVLYAGELGGTVGVDDTLGTTVGRCS